MAADRRSGGGRRRRGPGEEAWVPVSGLLVGLALLLAGLLGFLTSALALPAAPVLNAVREGREVADDRLARAAAALERSVRWGGNPAASLSQLALLKLVRSRSQGASASEELRLLTEALADQEASLGRAPANTDGWARLAYARYTLSGLDRASRDALAMSFLTGRLERAPMVFRLQLILREWEALGSEMHALGRLQIRRLSGDDQRAVDALVDVYLASDRAGREVIRAVLERFSEGHARFERRVRYRSRSR